MKHIPWLTVIILTSTLTISYAEVVTDGSLGNVGIQTLTAPNYLIGENLGQRQGANLFHSFTHFNVLQGETATFQASAHVNNILARVTGNEVSTINGTLSTNQSNANLWLVNPNGWLLGSHSRFDINGALHITTANAVGFGPGEKFYADLKQTSQLSTGEPLTLELDKPSQAEITIDQADLQLPAHQTASFTAPKVNLNQSALSAPGGQILLGGLSPGVWTLDAQQGLKGQQPAQGAISLTGHYAISLGQTKALPKPITTSQKGLIKGGIVKTEAIDGGLIQFLASSVNLQDAIVEQSAVSGGQSGNIAITANTVALGQGSRLSSNVVEKGDAGNISIQADDMQLADGATISSNSQFASEGDAGHVQIGLGHNLNMAGNSSIAAYNNGSGAGGVINITAGHIRLDTDSAVRVNSNDTGVAGQLNITTNTLDLSHGGTIDSSALAQGQGGDIAIQAHQIAMADPESFVTSSAFGAGQGGRVTIQTDQLDVAKQAQIRTLSEGTGNAGKIQLKVNGQLRLDNAQITTQAKQSDGGAIQINAGTVFLRHGQVTTSVEGPQGDGGDITMATSNLVMDGGFIQANTAAKNAFGGDVKIDAKRLFASGGEVLVGGKTRLQYDPQSRLNVIQAAAEQGVSGNVTVNTVELNLAGQLLPLDSRFISHTDISDNPCRVLRGQKLSSLIAKGHGGLPATAADMPIAPLGHYLPPSLSCPEMGL